MMDNIIRGKLVKMAYGRLARPTSLTKWGKLFMDEFPESYITYFHEKKT